MSLHPIEPGAEARADRHQTSDRALQFEVVPNLCTIADVCHFLRISARQFHYLMARKELALVEGRRLDRKRRFLGESVVREMRRRV